MIDTRSQRAAQIFDDFFDYGGDFGAPRFEAPLARTIAHVHNDPNTLNPGYIDSFRSVYPFQKTEEPPVLVMNDRMKKLFDDAHHSLLFREVDCHSGETVKEVISVGAVGIRDLTAMIGMRQTIVEMTRMGENERSITSTNEQSGNGPSWFVRLNAIAHGKHVTEYDVLYSLKEELATEVHVTDLQKNLIVERVAPKRLGAAVLSMLGDVVYDRFSDVIDWEVFFPKLQQLYTFHQSSNSPNKVFDPVSQQESGGSVVNAMSESVREQLQNAFTRANPTLSESVDLQEVENVLQRIWYQKVSGLQMFTQVEDDEKPRETGAILVPDHTFEVMNEIVAPNDISIVSMSPREEYVSFWLQRRHLVTVVPSMIAGYSWARVDKLMDNSKITSDEQGNIAHTAVETFLDKSKSFV